MLDMGTIVLDALKKIEQYKNTFKGGSSVEPAKYPPKVKSENVFTTLEC